jgi:hypothetical protein
MPDHDGEVLVATEMRRPRVREDAERLVAARLRPAVAVEIGEEPVVGLAMQMHGAAEGCLRQGTLRADALPVVGPAA